MSIDVIYTASSGNKYNLKASGLGMDRETNFHSWTYSPNTTQRQYGDKLNRYEKEALTYSAKLYFRDSIEDSRDMIEALHEDFELDISNETPGKISWNDWYIECYVQSSTLTPGDDNGYVENEVEIYAPYPFWIKDATKTFNASSGTSEYEFLDYTFDYEYDYTPADVGVAKWITHHAFKSEFLMRIYGPCSNPKVVINGHVYQVYCSLGNGEYLLINSREGTAYKYSSTGVATNVFDLRDKTSSLFYKIPGGTLTLTWPGTFKFDLTLYEERSEPLWTTA